MERLAQVLHGPLHAGHYRCPVLLAGLFERLELSFGRLGLVVQYPSGVWYLKQGFDGATFDWNTAGLNPGTYTVHVWANQAGDSTKSWEAYGTSVVTLGSATTNLGSIATPTLRSIS